MNSTQIYEFKAYNDFIKRFNKYIKKSIIAEYKYSPFDCTIQTTENKNYLVELKKYNSTFENNTRIPINYNNKILIPKFTCNLKKVINLYSEYKQRIDLIDGVYGINLFDDITTKVEISEYFDEIIPHINTINKYRDLKWEEHFKIYKNNNLGKSQIKFSKSGKLCVFLENASSFVGACQEFKIAFF